MKFLLVGMAAAMLTMGCQSEDESSGMTNDGSQNDAELSVTITNTTCEKEVAPCLVNPTQNILLSSDDKQLSASYSFMDMGDNCVLAVRSEKDGLIPSLIFPSKWWGDGEPLIVNESTSVVPTEFQQMKLVGTDVMMCSDTICRLGKFVPTGEEKKYTFVVEMLPAFNGAVMANWEVLSKHDVLCAYGDGVFCYVDDTWEQLVAPQTGESFLGISAIASVDETLAFVAVGESGRFGMYQDGVWVEQMIGDGENLVQVEVYDNRISMATSGGALIYGDFNNRSFDLLHRCVPGNLSFRFAELWFDGSWVDLPGKIHGVTPDGRYVQGQVQQNDALCQTDTLFENVKDASFHPCVAANNFIVVTNTAVYGSYKCVAEF